VEAAMAADPAVAESHHKRGRELLQKGAYQQAIEELTKAILLNPRHALALNARGFAYMQIREARKAVADFAAAIEIDPDYVNARQNLAAAQRLKKE